MRSLIVAQSLHLADIQLSARGCKKVNDSPPEWETPNGAGTVIYVPNAIALYGQPVRARIFLLPDHQKHSDWENIERAIVGRRLDAVELV